MIEIHLGKLEIVLINQILDILFKLDLKKAKDKRQVCHVNLKLENQGPLHLFVRPNP